MIFVDSGFLYAYVNERDKSHNLVRKKMREIMSGNYGSILISNYIIDESLTLARARTKKCNVGKRIQKLIQKSIAEKPLFQIMIIDSLIIPKIDEYYEKYCEKGLSYTDCSILAVMKKLKIEYLATISKEFEGLVTII